MNATSEEKDLIKFCREFCGSRYLDLSAFKVHWTSQKHKSAWEENASSWKSRSGSSVSHHRPSNESSYSPDKTTKPSNHAILSSMNPSQSNNSESKNDRLDKPATSSSSSRPKPDEKSSHTMSTGREDTPKNTKSSLNPANSGDSRNSVNAPSTSGTRQDSKSSSAAISKESSNPYRPPSVPLASSSKSPSRTPSEKHRRPPSPSRRDEPSRYDSRHHDHRYDSRGRSRSPRRDRRDISPDRRSDSHRRSDRYRRSPSPPPRSSSRRGSPPPAPYGSSRGPYSSYDKEHSSSKRGREDDYKGRDSDRPERRRRTSSLDPPRHKSPRFDGDSSQKSSSTPANDRFGSRLEPTSASSSSDPRGNFSSSRTPDEQKPNSNTAFEKPHSRASRPMTPHDSHPPTPQHPMQGPPKNGKEPSPRGRGKPPKSGPPPKSKKAKRGGKKQAPSTRPDEPAPWGKGKPSPKNTPQNLPGKKNKKQKNAQQKQNNGPLTTPPARKVQISLSSNDSPNNAYNRTVKINGSPSNGVQTANPFIPAHASFPHPAAGSSLPYSAQYDPRVPNNTTNHDNVNPYKPAHYASTPFSTQSEQSVQSLVSNVQSAFSSSASDHYKAELFSAIMNQKTTESSSYGDRQLNQNGFVPTLDPTRDPRSPPNRQQGASTSRIFDDKPDSSKESMSRRGSLRQMQEQLSRLEAEIARTKAMTATVAVAATPSPTATPLKASPVQSDKNVEDTTVQHGVLQLPRMAPTPAKELNESHESDQKGGETPVSEKAPSSFMSQTERILRLLGKKSEVEPPSSQMTSHQEPVESQSTETILLTVLSETSDNQTDNLEEKEKDTVNEDNESNNETISQPLPAQQPLQDTENEISCTESSPQLMSTPMDYILSEELHLSESFVLSSTKKSSNQEHVGQDQQQQVAKPSTPPMKPNDLIHDSTKESVASTLTPSDRTLTNTTPAPLSPHKASLSGAPLSSFYPFGTATEALMYYWYQNAGRNLDRQGLDALFKVLSHPSFSKEELCALNSSKIYDGVHSLSQLQLFESERK